MLQQVILLQNMCSFGTLGCNRIPYKIAVSRLTIEENKANGFDAIDATSSAVPKYSKQWWNLVKWITVIFLQFPLGWVKCKQNCP